ncbi:MAG TPA: hypothetical protein VKQ29_07290 [Aliidongia sp.]|nr:hypothetical protein [Aliidongia sp.]
MADEMDKVPENIEAILETLDRIRSRQRGISARSFVPILTSALSIFIAIVTYQNNAKVEDLKNDLDGRRTVLAEQQADANLMISVLHETLPAIGSNDLHKTKVLQALLLSLEGSYRGREQQKIVDNFFISLEAAVVNGSDDSSVKSFGAFALEEADVPDHARATVASAQASSASATPAPVAASAPPPPPAPVRSPTGTPEAPARLDLSKTIVRMGSDKGWDYDVFWCEGADDKLKDVARSVFQTLADRQQADGLGRLRLRMLPQSVNAVAGYQVTGLQLRRNPDKVDEANRLKGWIDPVAKAVAPGGFQFETSGQKLPCYLSIFVCPGAT